MKSLILILSSKWCLQTACFPHCLPHHRCCLTDDTVNGQGANTHCQALVPGLFWLSQVIGNSLLYKTAGNIVDNPHAFLHRKIFISNNFTLLLFSDKCLEQMFGFLFVFYTYIKYELSINICLVYRFLFWFSSLFRQPSFPIILLSLKIFYSLCFSSSRRNSWEVSLGVQVVQQTQKSDGQTEGVQKRPH